MGANMADATIATTSVAGSSTAARSNGANQRSRADALRQVSAPRPNSFAFTKQIVAASDQEPAPQQLATADPGNGLLSTGSQLVLAETRTQEDQSSFADKSVLDKALDSYGRSQSSVLETIGLALLSSGPTTSRTGETSA